MIQKLWESARVIRVLVRNKNAIDSLRSFPQRAQPPQRFLAAEPRIHQKASLLRFEQRGVAGTARSQNGNSEADAPSLAAQSCSGLRASWQTRATASTGVRGKNKKSYCSENTAYTVACCETFLGNSFKFGGGGGARLAKDALSVFTVMKRSTGV